MHQVKRLVRTIYVKRSRPEKTSAQNHENLTLLPLIRTGSTLLVHADTPNVRKRPQNTLS